jgi:hypothetical protein
MACRCCWPPPPPPPPPPPGECLRCIGENYDPNGEIIDPIQDILLQINGFDGGGMLFADGTTLSLDGVYSMVYSKCIQFEYYGASNDCADPGNYIGALASAHFAGGESNGGIVIGILGYRETCLGQFNGYTSAPFGCQSISGRFATDPPQTPGIITLHPFESDFRDFLCGGIATLSGSFTGTWSRFSSDNTPFEGCPAETAFTYSYNWSLSY